MILTVYNFTKRSTLDILQLNVVELIKIRVKFVPIVEVL